MNATTRLLAILDRLTALLYQPHRPPYVSGSYDPATRVIDGHALIRILREQRPASRVRQLSA